jgi:hypothetical protein
VGREVFVGVEVAFTGEAAATSGGSSDDSETDAAVAEEASADATLSICSFTTLPSHDRPPVHTGPSAIESMASPDYS